MKKLLLLVISIIIVQASFSQNFYHATAGEMIFGFSNAEYTHDNSGLNSNNKADDISDAMRFSVWLHLGYYYHMDFTNKFGAYTGIVNRNVGFITVEKPSDKTLYDPVKYKRRSYTFGVPLALKFGNLKDGMYVFLGAQYDMFYHFKQKEFAVDGKKKYAEWFSDRVNLLIPSVFAGVSFPGGLSVKVTYALNDMMNRDFSIETSSGTIKPYENMNSRLIYTSLYFMTNLSKAYAQVTKEEKKLMAEGF